MFSCHPSESRFLSISTPCCPLIPLFRFASSDDDSDSIEPPFGRRMRPRANSKSNLALPRESYMVAPADEDQQQQQQQQQAIPSRSHNRSSSAMSVSQMIKQAEKNIANQSTAKPGRTASSGPVSERLRDLELGEIFERGRGDVVDKFIIA